MVGLPIDARANLEHTDISSFPHLGISSDYDSFVGRKFELGLKGLQTLELGRLDLSSSTS